MAGTQTTQTKQANNNQQQQKKELVDLECDDEFEEFNEEEWSSKDEEHEDCAQWEDDWDDTEQDDFKTNLREELATKSKQQQQKH